MNNESLLDISGGAEHRRSASLQHLRAFVTVAETRGFTRAARALGLSQPAVTQQVKALERRYGVTLFHRRGGRLELTDAGRRTVELARRAVALADDTERALVETGALAGAELRVGADGPFSAMPLLADFLARHPRVRLSAQMGSSETVLRELLELRTDVAVLTLAAPDPRFHGVAYAPQRVVVFVARTHAWGERRAIPIRELEGVPMIFREPGSATRAIFERALTSHGVRPRVVMELGSREAIREAVAAGLGAGFVLESELGADERLRALALKGAAVEGSEYVLCLPERRSLRTVEAFLALARARATVRAS